MIATRHLLWPTLVFALLCLAISNPLQGQITIEGKVLNSSGGNVGGAEVAIYVVGNRDAIDSQKSNATTGEYHFHLKLSGAFDIMYTHSKYETATVSRLADQDNQHVSKVIYLKGEKKPLTAVQEQFLSARRLIFLANALDNKENQKIFVIRFEDEIFKSPSHNLDEMSLDKLTERMHIFLQTEQKQIETLREITLKEYLGAPR